LWIFVTNSFSVTRNSIIARCLKPTLPYHAILKTLAHARESVLFRGAAVESGTFKINYTKKLQAFRTDFD
jgi:hypothetical protein